MDSQSFTLLHVAISLGAILSGFVVMYGLLAAEKLSRWTALFLISTVLTSVTGFFFHRTHILPSHIVGIISLVLLGAVGLGLYVFRFKGIWRAVYVVGAVARLYLNVFVLIVQAFLKVRWLRNLAPTQTREPAFVGVPGPALLLFVTIGVLSLMRFRPTNGLVQ